MVVDMKGNVVKSDNEMTDKEIEKVARVQVTNALASMLINDIIEDNGIESFKGWCEDGDIFSEIKNEAVQKRCVEIMNEISDAVDNLTYQHLAVDKFFEDFQ